MSVPPLVAFSPGAGLGLVVWPTVALIESADRDVMERLWQGLAVGDRGDDFIEDLSITGLRGLGSFVVAQFEGLDVRLYVRGSARARFRSESATGEIDGGSVRTWVEQLVPGCESLDLAIDGVFGVDEPFRVGSGVVPASRLSWSLSNAREDAPDSDSTTGAPLSMSVERLVLEGEASEAGQPIEHEPGDARRDPIEADDLRSDELELGHIRPGDDADPMPSTGSDGSTCGLFSDPVDTGQTLHFAARDSDGAADPSAPPPDVRPATEEPLLTEDVDDYDYDALFGRTTHRSVQDAAVAEPAETEVSEQPHEPDTQVLETPSQPAATPASAPVGDVPSIGGGLISGVPMPGASTGDVPASMADSGDPGDHDGLTMTVAQLRALRESGDGPVAQPLPEVGGGPTVQALVCHEGHPNPTVVDICRRCGASLVSAQVVIPRPSLGVIRLSSGQSIELGRSAIVGRNPRVEGTMHGEVPSIVKIEGIEALSRSHAMIRLEGWQVLVEDLDSANGTTVTLQGRPPRRLRAGEPIILEHGALIDFGGEVTGTYDALV